MRRLARYGYALTLASLGVLPVSVAIAAFVVRAFGTDSTNTASKTGSAGDGGYPLAAETADRRYLAL